MNEENKRQRLVVELNSTTAEDLDYLTETEGLNKTTIVNRSVQLYKTLTRICKSGGEVFVQEKDGELQRLFFL